MRRAQKAAHWMVSQLEPWKQRQQIIRVQKTLFCRAGRNQAKRIREGGLVKVLHLVG